MKSIPPCPPIAFATSLISGRHRGWRYLMRISSAVAGEKYPCTGSPAVSDGESPSLEVLLANYEREILQDAIRKNDGNLSAAGRTLGLSPRMMNYRMNRLGLKKES